MPLPARSALALAAALHASVALAQHDPASPPPARAFGRDTVAYGLFTGEGVTPGLACDDPADPATPRTCSGFLASDLDGTRLDVSVVVPRTPPPHPLVVAIHGWGGQKGSMSRYDAPLVGAGFAVLRYSTRGFGESWGQANLADVHVEGADLRSMIGQVVDSSLGEQDGTLPVDAGAVAVFGASYGGAHAWLGALEPAFRSPGGRDVTIRTVVPVAGWTDLLEALVPNGLHERAQDVAGAEKLSFLQGLFVGGIRTNPARPYPNYAPYLAGWDAFLTVNEAPYPATLLGQQIVDGLQGHRSAYWQAPFWDRVRANVAAGVPQLPILAIQGWTDDLFPVREAVRMADALHAIDPAYPIALYLGDVGHPRAANKPDEVKYALDLAVAWLRYHLSGVGSAPTYDVRAAITRPRAAPFDPADVIVAPTYEALEAGLGGATFGKARLVTFQPLNVSGVPWDPLVLSGCAELDPCPEAPELPPVPGDVAVYEVPVNRVARGPGALLLAGEPSVTVRLRTTAHRVQLHARLFDVAPDGTRALITRGTLTVDAGLPALPIGPLEVTIPTNGNLWEAPRDHRLRLELTNVDLPYFRPSLVPSATVLEKVELVVPFGER